MSICPRAQKLVLLLASQLNQPLPFDVLAGEWRAELHRWTPSLRHAGIEQLTIGFSKVSCCPHRQLTTSPLSSDAAGSLDCCRSVHPHCGAS